MHNQLVCNTRQVSISSIFGNSIAIWRVCTGCLFTGAALSSRV